MTPGLEPHEENGFVIMTAASDQGNGRHPRPAPACADARTRQQRIDPELSPERAAEIAKECCRPIDDFEWYPVGKAVGDVRNQGPELI